MARCDALPAAEIPFARAKMPIRKEYPMPLVEAKMDRTKVIWPTGGNERLWPSKFKITDLQALLTARTGSPKFLNKGQVEKLFEKAKKLEAKKAASCYVKVGVIGTNLVLRVKTVALIGGHVGDVILLKNYPAKATAYIAFGKFKKTATIKELWGRRGWQREVYLFFKSIAAEESVHFLSAFEAMEPTSALEKQRFYGLYVADNAPWQLTGGAGMTATAIKKLQEQFSGNDFANMDFNGFFGTVLGSLEVQEQVKPWRDGPKFFALACDIELDLRALKV
jgi:hypothetical protein